MIMKSRDHQFHSYKDRALYDLFTAQFGYIGCGFASVASCLTSNPTNFMASNLIHRKQDSLAFSSNVNAVVQTRFHHHEKLKKIVLTWLLHSRSVLGFFFRKLLLASCGVCVSFSMFNAIYIVGR